MRSGRRRQPLLQPLLQQLLQHHIVLVLLVLVLALPIDLDVGGRQGLATFSGRRRQPPATRESAVVACERAVVALSLSAGSGYDCCCWARQSTLSHSRGAGVE